jgi:hypothetical protein
METLIGFAVGYFVGAQQGRDGLRKVVDAADAIRNSPEARQAVLAGAAVAGSMVRRVLGGDGNGVLHDVVDLLGRMSGGRSTEQVVRAA